VSDVFRALEQIEAIHDQLAKGEVYRGWRSLPVAASGVVGIAAAAGQSGSPNQPWLFVGYWLAVAVVAFAVGCSEIAWHYVRHADDTERRRTRLVIGQLLPALVAGAIATVALMQLDPPAVAILPGLWAMMLGVGIFAARPYLPPACIWTALFYWSVGLLLLWGGATAGRNAGIAPWGIGLTFGVGQLLAAFTLYWTLERRQARGDSQA